MDVAVHPAAGPRATRGGGPGREAAMNGSFWPHRNGGNKRHNGGRRALWSAAALRAVAIGTVVIGTVVIGTAALAACGRVAASGSGAGCGHASPPASAGA